MPAVCAPGLAVWLLTHAADAQSLAGTFPLEAALRWADTSMPPPRWRSNDPDLLRPGVTTAAATLAEGATVTVTTAVDLDGDGRDEVLLQVAPRADPSPENTHPGLVLLHPVGGQWFTQVLARGAPWYGDGDFRDTAPAQPFAWSVVRDGARRRLVIGYVTSVTDENPSGHGHGSWPLYAALRIALVAGEPRVDGLCDRDEYPDPGNHVWRSSHIACVDGEGRTRPLAACTWTHFAEPWDREGPGPWVRSERDAATAAWCRAFARGPRHRL